MLLFIEPQGRSLMSHYQCMTIEQPRTAEQAYSLLVADWRRQVHALYRAVRAAHTPQVAHALWIAGRTELFNQHGASPRMSGQQLRHADYDPAYRFTLPLAAAGPDHFDAATGTDGVAPFDRIGQFRLPAGPAHIAGSAGAGVETLDLWWLGSYGGGLFLPVRDGSAGRETYGAGRYVIDTTKGADLGRSATISPEDIAPAEEWIVDLNFAYNPSCVYDPRWACPLAPAGNRIVQRAIVGELLPTGY
jgi:uncharacterized protein (DUF1684 family)